MDINNPPQWFILLIFVAFAAAIFFIYRRANKNK